MSVDTERAPGQMADHPLLTRAALRTFDDTALALVMRAQDHGWRGYVGSSGHVFLKAPDGVHTMSVSRDSLRGRSGRNARSVLERWIKAQPAPAELTAPPEPGASFGTPTPEPESFVLPPALLIEARRQGVTDWLLDNRDLRLGKDWVGWIDEDDPRRWFVVDIRHKQVTVIGRGSAMPEADMHAILRKHYPWLFKGQPGASTNTEPGGNTMRVLLCDHEGCEYRTDHAGALNLHRKSHEPVVMVTCPFPGCGRQLNEKSMPQHSRSHTDVEPQQCPVCENKTLVGRRGLTTHMSRSHPGVDLEQAIAHAAQADAPVGSPVVTGVSPVADGAVTVAPPAYEGGGGVLLDHLEHLPEGEDAEAQIAAVRAVVAGPLVAELRRLKADNERLEREVKDLTGVNGELQAKLSLMREALGL